MKFKLAVCQIRTEVDQDETLAKAGRMVREAAENGAEVVAFPETPTSTSAPTPRGVTKGQWRCFRAGRRKTAC